MTDVTLKDLHELLMRLNTKSDETQDTLSEIKSELLNSNNKILNLEEENAKLKEKNIQLDRKLRRNNIVVFGLQSDTPEQGLEYLKDTLEVDLDLRDLNNIFFIPGKGTETKILKLELLSYLKKTEILRNLRKLKGENVYVMDDLSPEDQAVNKALRQYLNQAKQDGIKATIKRSHLILNDKKFSLEDLQLDPSIIKDQPTSSNAEDANSKRKNSSPLENIATKKPSREKSRRAAKGN